MDTEFINRIKGYAALFMAVMAAILLVPVDGYSSEREYPDVILDTRLEADVFSGGSLQAVSKDGWMFYMWIYGIADREWLADISFPLGTILLAVLCKVLEQRQTFNDRRVCGKSAGGNPDFL